MVASTFHNSCINHIVISHCSKYQLPSPECDCTRISASDCTSIECGKGQYCGLGRIFPGIIPVHDEWVSYNDIASHMYTWKAFTISSMYDINTCTLYAVDWSWSHCNSPPLPTVTHFLPSWMQDWLQWSHNAILCRMWLLQYIPHTWFWRTWITSKTLQGAMPRFVCTLNRCTHDVTSYDIMSINFFWIIETCPMGYECIVYVFIALQSACIIVSHTMIFL